MKKIKKKKKCFYVSLIIFCIILIAIQTISFFNAVKGTFDEDTANEKTPIEVSTIIEGLGESVKYSVFANTFYQQSHMEGNIAVKNAYIGHIFNFTNAVYSIYDDSTEYSITIENSVNGTMSDGTFRFAVFTKEQDKDGNEEYVIVNNQIVEITTKNGKGTATFDNLDVDEEYYIFQLDDNDEPIMDGTTTSDGVTITYESGESTKSKNSTVVENTSYIEKICQWSSHAADDNNGKNPKLIIPKSQFLELKTNSNGSLVYGSDEIVFEKNYNDFELIVLDNNNNFKVVYNQETADYELEERANDYKTIDFENEFSKLNQFSAKLYNNYKSSDSVNVLYLDADGSVYQNEEINGLNYGNADSQELDVSEYLKNNKYLILNVDTSGMDELNLSNTINWGDLQGTLSWNAVSTRILWNFYNAEDNTPYTGKINIHKNNIIGTLLAPSAEIVVGCTINANVIANQVSNPGGEIHKAQFASVISSKSVKCYNNKYNNENNEIEIAEGTFSLQLVKVDSADTTKQLAGAQYEVKIKKDNKEIYDEVLTTEANGYVSIPATAIESENEVYTVEITEKKAPEGYSLNSKTVTFSFKTTKVDGKYQLEIVDEQIIENAKVRITENVIVVDVMNDKLEEQIIENKYDIEIHKINSETEEGLNGVKIHIEMIDDEQNELINEQYVTDDYNDNPGYIIVNDISMLKEGIHTYKIDEIETPDGYLEFEESIIFEVEVGLNSEGNDYEIKSIKNISDYDGKVKIEKEDGENKIKIVLPNDPKKETSSVPNQKTEEKEEVQSNIKSGILPQTGEMGTVIIAIGIIVVSLGVIVFSMYKLIKKND